MQSVSEMGTVTPEKFMQLIAESEDIPLRRANAQAALGRLAEAMRQLADFGYHFTIREDSPPEGPQYPKMLYSGAGPSLRTMIVNSLDEERKARGWRTAPNEMKIGEKK